MGERNNVVLWRGCLCIKGVFACSAQMLFSKFLEKPANLSHCMNVSWKMGLAETRERYLKNVPQLDMETETSCNGWYINVGRMMPILCQSNFDKLAVYLLKNNVVAVLRLGGEVLLLMTDSKLTEELGFTKNENQTVLHCIILSKQSKLKTEKSSSFPASTARMCSSMQQQHHSVHKTDLHISQRVLAARSNRSLDSCSSHSLDASFSPWPPHSSLLTCDKIINAFVNKESDSSVTNTCNPGHSYVKRISDRTREEKENELENPVRKRHKSDMSSTYNGIVNEIDGSEGTFQKTRKRHYTFNLTNTCTSGLNVLENTTIGREITLSNVGSDSTISSYSSTAYNERLKTLWKPQSHKVSETGGCSKLPATYMPTVVTANHLSERACSSSANMFDIIAPKASKSSIKISASECNANELPSKSKGALEKGMSKLKNAVLISTDLMKTKQGIAYNEKEKLKEKTTKSNKDLPTPKKTMSSSTLCKNIYSPMSKVDQSKALSTPSKNIYSPMSKVDQSKGLSTPSKNIYSPISKEDQSKILSTPSKVTKSTPIKAKTGPTKSNTPLSTPSKEDSMQNKIPFTTPIKNLHSQINVSSKPINSEKIQTKSSKPLSTPSKAKKSRTKIVKTPLSSEKTRSTMRSRSPTDDAGVGSGKKRNHDQEKTHHAEVKKAKVENKLAETSHSKSKKQHSSRKDGDRKSSEITVIHKSRLLAIKQRDAEKVLSSMQIGLKKAEVKQLGRIPKKNKTFSPTPRQRVKAIAVESCTLKPQGIERITNNSHSFTFDSCAQLTPGGDFCREQTEEGELTAERIDHCEIVDRLPRFHGDSKKAKIQFLIGDGDNKYTDKSDKTKSDGSKTIKEKSLKTREFDELFSQVKAGSNLMTIPGFGDLDPVEHMSDQPTTGEGDKKVYRIVTATKTGTCIRVSGLDRKKLGIDIVLQLPDIIKMVLHGHSYINSPMSGQCLESYNAIMSIHQPSPTSLCRKVTNKDNNCIIETTGLSKVATDLAGIASLTTEVSDREAEHIPGLSLVSRENETDNQKKRKTGGNVDQVTSKLMSILHGEQSSLWKYNIDLKSSEKFDVKSSKEVDPKPTTTLTIPQMKIITPDTSAEDELLHVIDKDSNLLTEILTAENLKKYETDEDGIVTEILTAENLKKCETDKDRKNVTEILTAENLKKHQTDKDRKIINENLTAKNFTKCETDKNKKNVTEILTTEKLKIYQNSTETINKINETQNSVNNLSNKTDPVCTTPENKTLHRITVEDSVTSGTETATPELKSDLKHKEHTERNRRPPVRDKEHGHESSSGDRSRKRSGSVMSSSRERSHSSTSEAAKGDRSEPRRRRQSGLTAGNTTKSEATESTSTDISKRLAELSKTEVTRSEKRQERQYHPYRKDNRRDRSYKPSWSFDLAYRDMNELLQNLTENCYRSRNCKPTVYKSNRRYGKSGRFRSFWFRRSAVPTTPPRCASPSYSDDGRVQVELAPDIIPNLEARGRQADMMEEIFMGSSKEEAEFKTEMLAYNSEQIEETPQRNVVSKSLFDRVIVSNKGRGTNVDTSLVIPGGPKTSTYSGAEIDEFTVELICTGDTRKVAIDRGDNCGIDLRGSTVSIGNKIQKADEIKTTYTEKKNTADTGQSSNEPALKSLSKSDVEPLPIRRIPEKKLDENDKAHILISKSRSLIKLGKGDQGLDNSLKTDSRSIANEVANSNKHIEDSKVNKHMEDSKANKPMEDFKANKDMEDSKANKHTEDSKAIGRDKIAILSSESDIQLDWNDEDITLENATEPNPFEESSDDCNESGESKTYVIVDMLSESDTDVLHMHRLTDDEQSDKDHLVLNEKSGASHHSKKENVTSCSEESNSLDNKITQSINLKGAAVKSGDDNTCSSQYHVIDELGDHNVVHIDSDAEKTEHETEHMVQLPVYAKTPDENRLIGLQKKCVSILTTQSKVNKQVKNGDKNTSIGTEEPLILNVIKTENTNDDSVLCHTADKVNVKCEEQEHTIKELTKESCFDKGDNGHKTAECSEAYIKLADLVQGHTADRVGHTADGVTGNVTNQNCGSFDVEVKISLNGTLVEAITGTNTHSNNKMGLTEYQVKKEADSQSIFIGNTGDCKGEKDVVAKDLKRIKHNDVDQTSICVNKVTLDECQSENVDHKTDIIQDVKVESNDLENKQILTCILDIPISQIPLPKYKNPQDFAEKQNTDIEMDISKNLYSRNDNETKTGDKLELFSETSVMLQQSSNLSKMDQEEKFDSQQQDVSIYALTESVMELRSKLIDRLAANQQIETLKVETNSGITPLRQTETTKTECIANDDLEEIVEDTSMNLAKVELNKINQVAQKKKESHSEVMTTFDQTKKCSSVGTVVFHNNIGSNVVEETALPLNNNLVYQECQKHFALVGDEVSKVVQRDHINKLINNTKSTVADTENGNQTVGSSAVSLAPSCTSQRDTMSENQMANPCTRTETGSEISGEDSAHQHCRVKSEVDKNATKEVPLELNLSLSDNNMQLCEVAHTEIISHTVKDMNGNSLQTQPEQYSKAESLDGNVAPFSQHFDQHLLQYDPHTIQQSVPYRCDTSSYMSPYLFRYTTPLPNLSDCAFTAGPPCMQNNRNITDVENNLQSYEQYSPNSTRGPIFISPDTSPIEFNHPSQYFRMTSLSPQPPVMLPSPPYWTYKPRPALFHPHTRPRFDSHSAASPIPNSPRLMDYVNGGQTYFSIVQECSPPQSGPTSSSTVLECPPLNSGPTYSSAMQACLPSQYNNSILTTSPNYMTGIYPWMISGNNMAPFIRNRQNPQLYYVFSHSHTELSNLSESERNKETSVEIEGYDEGRKSFTNVSERFVTKCPQHKENDLKLPSSVGKDSFVERTANSVRDDEKVNLPTKCFSVEKNYDSKRSTIKTREKLEYFGVGTFLSKLRKSRKESKEIHNCIETKKHFGTEISLGNGTKVGENDAKMTGMETELSKFYNELSDGEIQNCNETKVKAHGESEIPNLESTLEKQSDTVSIMAFPDDLDCQDVGRKILTLKELCAKLIQTFKTQKLDSPLDWSQDCKRLTDTSEDTLRKDIPLSDGYDSSIIPLVESNIEAQSEGNDSFCRRLSEKQVEHKHGGKNEDVINEVSKNCTKDKSVNNRRKEFQRTTAGILKSEVISLKQMSETSYRKYMVSSETRPTGRCCIGNKINVKKLAQSDDCVDKIFDKPFRPLYIIKSFPQKHVATRDGTVTSKHFLTNTNTLGAKQNKTNSEEIFEYSHIEDDIDAELLQQNKVELTATSSMCEEIKTDDGNEKQEEISVFESNIHTESFDQDGKSTNSNIVELSTTNTDAVCSSQIEHDTHFQECGNVSEKEINDIWNGRLMTSIKPRSELRQQEDSACEHDMKLVQFNLERNQHKDWLDDAVTVKQESNDESESTVETRPAIDYRSIKTETCDLPSEVSQCYTKTDTVRSFGLFSGAENRYPDSTEQIETTDVESNCAKDGALETIADCASEYQFNENIHNYQSENTAANNYRSENTAANNYRSENTAANYYRSENTVANTGNYRSENTAAINYHSENTVANKYRSENTAANNYHSENTVANSQKVSSNKSIIIKERSSGVANIKNNKNTLNCLSLISSVYEDSSNDCTADEISNAFKEVFCQSTGHLVNDTICSNSQHTDNIEYRTQSDNNNAEERTPSACVDSLVTVKVEVDSEVDSGHGTCNDLQTSIDEIFSNCRWTEDQPETEKLNSESISSVPVVQDDSIPEEKNDINIGQTRECVETDPCSFNDNNNAMTQLHEKHPYERVKHYITSKQTSSQIKPRLELNDLQKICFKMNTIKMDTLIGKRNKDDNDAMADAANKRLKRLQVGNAEKIFRKCFDEQRIERTAAQGMNLKPRISNSGISMIRQALWPQGSALNKSNSIPSLGKNSQSACLLKEISMSSNLTSNSATDMSSETWRISNCDHGNVGRNTLRKGRKTALKCRGRTEVRSYRVLSSSSRSSSSSSQSSSRSSSSFSQSHTSSSSDSSSSVSQSSSSTSSHSSRSHSSSSTGSSSSSSRSSPSDNHVRYSSRSSSSTSSVSSSPTPFMKSRQHSRNKNSHTHTCLSKEIYSIRSSDSESRYEHAISSLGAKQFLHKHSDLHAGERQENRPPSASSRSSSLNYPTNRHNSPQEYNVELPPGFTDYPFKRISQQNQVFHRRSTSAYGYPEQDSSSTDSESSRSQSPRSRKRSLVDLRQHGTSSTSHRNRSFSRQSREGSYSPSRFHNRKSFDASKNHDTKHYYETASKRPQRDPNFQRKKYYRTDSPDRESSELRLFYSDSSSSEPSRTRHVRNNKMRHEHKPSTSSYRTDPVVLDHRSSLSGPTGCKMKQKKVLIKSSTLYEMKPDKLWAMLRLLDQHSTQRCCWKLAILESQMEYLATNKHVRKHEEMCMYLSDRRYSNVTEIVTNQQYEDHSVPLQNFAARQLLYNDSILKYFLITDTANTLHQSHFHIVTCSFRDFLDKYLVSL